MPYDYNVKNILVGLAHLYYAPAVPVAEPYVADTVLLGQIPVAPPSNWRYIGAVEEGVQQAFSRATQEHNIENQSSAVLRTVTSSTIEISTSLVEQTMENMKLAYGGGTITQTAAAVGQPGKRRLTLSDELDFLSVILEGKNPEGFYRRYYIPRVVSTANVETNNRRAEAKKLLPVTLTAVCEITEIFVDDMVAAAL